MCETRFKTSLIRNLAAQDVDIYRQLLLCARSETQFMAGVDRLQCPALEATVYLLLMKLQEQRNDFLLPNLTWISVEKVFTLIEVNHLYLQKKEECFGLLLNVLALTVMLDQTESECAWKISNFLKIFQENYSELPIFYEVLRTLMIVSMEKEGLNQCFGHVDPSNLIRNLYSESHQIQMKSLCCLKLLVEYEPEIIYLWQSLIIKGETISLEHRSFMICQLVDTASQKKEQSGLFLRIIESQDIWQIIKSSCESDSHLIRKEALTTLKVMLGFLTENKASVENDLFYWTWKEMKPLSEGWQSFITLLETLSETQTHLIMPALVMVERLESLTTAWLNLVLQLLLKHENQSVSGWAIKHLLEKHKYCAQRDELEILFLNSLNKTSNFQQFNNIKNQLCQYYSGSEAFSFLLTHFKQVSWGSVPFACLLEVIDSLLDFSTDFHHVQSIVGLLEPTLSIRNLNLRHLSALQFSHMLVNLVLRRDIKPNVPLDRCLMHLEVLSKVTHVNFVALERWKELRQAVDGVTFERLLLRVKPGDINIIKHVLVPYMRNERASTERRLKQILDRDLLLAARILHYWKQSLTQPEVKIKFVNLLKNFNDNPDEALKALDIFDELATSQASWLDEVVHKLTLILHKRLNRLNYQIASISVTIQTVRLLCRLERIDMVDLFLGTFSMDELINTVQTGNCDKSFYGSTFTALSDVYLARLKPEPNIGEIKQRIACDSVKLVDLGDVQVLVNTLEVLTFVLANNLVDLTDESKFEWLADVVNRCYKEILVYRKSDHFIKLNRLFVSLLLAPSNIENTTELDGVNQWSKEIVSEYVQMFLDQAVVISGLANILFEKLLLVNIEILLDWSAFGKILLAGLLFGEGQKREQRIEDETCFASRFYDTSLCKPPCQFQSDARVRVLCVLFLYRMAATNHPDATLFLLKLERMLIEKFQQISKAKERYYADSQTHRHKLRIIQTLCVVSKLTGTKPYPLLDIVLYETNQPNINYLIELIVADSSIDTLTIINSLKADKVKVSGVQSVFVILWLRCCKTNYLDVEYINFLLPWTMSQNFSTRLYAQITISKLIEKFFEKPDTSSFANIHSAINSYLKQGNVEKNMEKCMKDFRFNSVLDYENLLTLQNVFNNIPRVSRMAQEDVVSSSILKECFERLKVSEINLGAAIVFDDTANETKENLFLSLGFGGSDHIQKKIVPLKCMEPAMELLTNLPERLCLRKKVNSDGLIVVASLVNRSPNLGGLARSCEIFAVKQYIVNSLKDVENKEFQALSMTAEKWLNVGELKAFQIVDYLIEMKSKGYSIVGAEQTTGSQPIQKVHFPKKSILVLGHEKEGLPAQIISHLDLVVEIPQFGVVRSLNVHVTGAIFMWEYAKQHHVVNVE
ncbi:uncharacterized protein LOC128734614 [Sabethes cyaneus]|uniref:uncharacterized protein LOC128734614 n=1 Tax=Sabethes cyaneus TaxID=53552 RepID=UPI00237E2FA1|nr:uncharacterized protein LOC128734614 [Sabethes cyaneus]